MYIPSEEMGDYEETRTTKYRKPSGVLFPLDEEGTYGRPPAKQPKAKPQPVSLKRERKPKVYASYAVSNDCSMHAEQLEKNETSGRRRPTPPRGKTPPAKKDSYPSRTKSYTPTRPREPREPATSKTKWQNTLRESSYPTNPSSWKDSLRGRDSISPSTPRVPRRTSTLPRTTPRRNSASVSPNRSRTISASPDRRLQSMSPDRGRRGSAERSGRSSADWGYTDFSTFTANRKSLDHSSALTQRRVSSDRRESSSSQRRDSSGGPRSSREEPALARKSSMETYSAGMRRSSTRDSTAGRDYFSSASAGREYSESRTVTSQEYSSSKNVTSARGRSNSPSKFSLTALKTPTINEWDDMGILGLTAKMFKESTNFKEGISSTSSSSYFRRESVTSKVM